MEDAERRRTEEKERRIKEQLAIQKEKEDAAEKVAARAFAKSYLQTLIPSVFDSLATNGYFYEAVEKELEISILPWLNTEVEKSLKKFEISRRLADGKLSLTIDIIMSAIKKYKGEKKDGI